MKFPTMFSPVQIGTVTVPNRFVVPPMGNNFANTDGTLSDRSLSYYQARAKGGFGLITIESTVVYKEAKGGPRKPCLFSDDTVDSFRRVADACHAYGAKVSIQLQHAGPEGNSALTGYPLKAASAMPAAVGREIPVAMPTEEVYRLIECYGDAARRAQQAGIDMVEVHCAHGYLVSTFISQRTNNRTDEFGGCFENRMRLPRLIIENIRRKTGGNLPILCRINATDEVEGGQTVQDAAAVAAYLEQECGVDALHVTRAVHLHDEFMWAPGITHGGFNANLVTEIKQAVSVPVIAVGRFTEPQYAELLVKQGRADLIAFGRQSIADPDLPAKARTGNLETLAPCIGCLLGCVPNMFAGRPISCAVNPCVGRESELTPAEVSKNVVVVGGGPGGLYAAWICALRGHQVTLFEKADHLGGALEFSKFVPFKYALCSYKDYLIAQVGKRAIDVKLNTEAAPSMLNGKFDAVLIAVGAEPLMLPLPGFNTENGIVATDAYGHEDTLGQRVVVIGGGQVGCETALHLADKGIDVSIIEMQDSLCPEASKTCADEIRILLEENSHFTAILGAKCKCVEKNAVTYTDAEGAEHTVKCDTVILAAGMRAKSALADSFATGCDVPEWAEIGDCVRARTVEEATAEAYNAAMEL